MEGLKREESRPTAALLERQEEAHPGCPQAHTTTRGRGEANWTDTMEQKRQVALADYDQQTRCQLNM